MKTMNLTVLKTLSMLSIGLLFFTACGQNNKTSQATAEVTVPKMDIHTAVISENLEVVKQHIASGTDLNQKEPFGGSTPLITAATFGKQEMVKTLIEAGADLNIQNNDGSTALHTAAFFCRIEIVQQLIDAKADKGVRNNYGSTARETVLGSFGDVKPIYQMLHQQLAPMGFELDLEEVEKSRPVVAMMLQ
ncbi:Ankyrin repeat-containing protein [Robiginitalea myxolifaciens]|uniref:Ankyrin repeat-containing protein n=1 Tax=Robiginitalea myxolifaciens TaxID=400055 RepID=A0A1I6G113_9FLAO|nr:ankyrin repeat domain-containing protein [Robiginitalea myxolifaciens]SFR35852.1 Ankyrin repeat-containing protein [Robiginitalea myxolifaciens]